MHSPRASARLTPHLHVSLRNRGPVPTSDLEASWLTMLTPLVYAPARKEAMDGKSPARHSTDAPQG